MALQAHIRELDARHQSLERRIDEERNHPAHDELRVTELKRQKLKLKEQLEALRAEAH